MALQRSPCKPSLPRSQPRWLRYTPHLAEILRSPWLDQCTVLWRRESSTSCYHDFNWAFHFGVGSRLKYATPMEYTFSPPTQQRVFRHYQDVPADRPVCVTTVYTPSPPGSVGPPPLLEPDYVIPSPVTYVRRPPQIVEKRVTTKVISVPVCGFGDKTLAEVPERHFAPEHRYQNAKVHEETERLTVLRYQTDKYVGLGPEGVAIDEYGAEVEFVREPKYPLRKDGQYPIWP